MKNLTNVEFLKYSLNEDEKATNLYYEIGKSSDFIKLFLVLIKTEESISWENPKTSKLAFSESLYISEMELDGNFFIADDNNIIIYGAVFSVLGFAIFVIICILILIKFKRRNIETEEEEKSTKHIYHSKVSETLDQSINKSDFEREELMFNMKSLKERKKLKMIQKSQHKEHFEDANQSNFIFSQKNLQESINFESEETKMPVNNFKIQK